MDAKRPILTVLRNPVFWSFAVVAAIGLASLLVRDDARLLARQLALLALIGAVLLSFRPLRSLLRNMPLVHQLALAAFFTAFLLGHFANGGRRTFPFVPWRMFGSNPNGKQFVEHVEVHGITADHRSVLINPERLYPSLGLGTTRLYPRLHGATRSALNAQRQKPANGGTIRTYNKLLLAIGKAHNRVADRPAERLEVVRVRAFVDRTTPTQRKTIWEVKLP